MKYVLFVFIFIFSGCGGNSANLLVNTGKKPPTFFAITDKKTMDEFVFDTQKFSFMFPSTKESDFTQRKGWRGMSDRDGHSISFSFKDGSVYHITISTDYNAREYGERDRALENNDIQYLRSNIRIDKNDNLYISRYGKENYICQVMEYTKKKYPNSKYIGYNCYKYNINKTKAKRIHIRLTYNKPNHPTLAKEYTYEDLQNRAKRMLDSLYIKDRW